jgi:hypothetical protein
MLKKAPASTNAEARSRASARIWLAFSLEWG